MGPQIARQTLATKRNMTNRTRMHFCQQKMRHCSRCRRRPLEQSFRTAIKLQAATSTLQRNINHPSRQNVQSMARFGFLKLEFGISLDVGAWDLELA
jgi:hypothetical protein